MTIFFKVFKILFLGLLIITISCNRDNLDEVTSIDLRLENGSINQTLNNTVHFKVLANNNTEVSSESQYVVNGSTLTGNVYTFTAIGSYIVQAKYKGILSNELKINVVDTSPYSQKVLVEDYTGTWCGYCTRVWYGINQAKAQSDKVIAVGIHVDGNDPYKFSASQDLRTTFNVGGLPEARINRTILWTKNHEHENIYEVINQTGPRADLGLKIISTRTNNVIDYSVLVGFNKNFYNDLNIVVYLVENGLVYPQVNYNSYVSGGQSPLPNFVHNEVLRALFTDKFGEPIPNDQTFLNDVYLKSFTNTIPATVSESNYNNLHLIAFVTDAETKEVINVQDVKVGETKDFD